ncbi:hypothetical protein [Fodinicola acaciae]|uniref:hypothetical protein n=1 Tax=Fodinicola acaciae TaxID=2681555 RepID=UPI0013D78939|nr:hypothetical protein [Fodinicola acaciae]
MMNIERVVLRFQQAVEVVNADSPGGNAVHLADDDTLEPLRAEFGDRIPEEITQFFSHIRSVELPGAWKGYTIGPPEWIAEVHRSGRPAYVRQGGKTHEVMIVASNGAGVLYALELPYDGPVWVLPHSTIEDGVYDADTPEALVYRPVGESFGYFVEQIATYALVREDIDLFDPYKLRW